jgi:hypothetical protein
MLKVFRAHHKKVFITLAIVIIPAFALWGGISFLRERREQAIAKVGNHLVNATEFRYYLIMAELNAAFLSALSDKKVRIPETDKTKTAYECLLLLWKANKEKISVSDAEVLERIKLMFFGNKPLNKNIYERLLRTFLSEHGLRMEVRTLEECIRNFLAIEKLVNKDIKIEISERDIRNFYQKDNQKAKISYISIPYEKFNPQVKIEEKELQDFFFKNKTAFREPPRIKLKYAIVTKESGLADRLKENFSKIKDIEELKNKFSIEVKETGFIAKNDPIEGLGWQPTLNQVAFSLKKEKLSPPLESNIGIIFLEKVEEKPSFIPELKEIKNEVETKIKEIRTKELAQTQALDILSKIKRQEAKNLKKTAEQQKLEYKETGEFKYYDYIEGLGLNEQISKIVFSLTKDEIYPYPILLSKGAFIIQLKDKTLIDEKEFQEKKQAYFEKFRKLRELQEQAKFLLKVSKETHAKLFSSN